MVYNHLHNVRNVELRWEAIDQLCFIEASMDMHVLNKEQINVMNLAMDGHNVFVGGKPGTGKTYIVKRAVSVLQKQNR